MYMIGIRFPVPVLLSIKGFIFQVLLSTKDNKKLVISSINKIKEQKKNFYIEIWHEINEWPSVIKTKKKKIKIKIFL